MHHFLIPATWGLLAFCSLIGWGLLIAQFVAPEQCFDFGLCAGWGMCLIVLIGGLLNATNQCGYLASILIVVIGCACFAKFAILKRRIQLRQSDWPYLALLAAAAYVYGASICWRRTWNPFDDFPAYLTYPIKMLSTGAAIDPFSFRRLSTFGGYAFLQTVASPFNWPHTAFTLDIGIGSLGICALCVGFLRKHGESPIVCAIMGTACLFLPLPRINSMCTTLGAFGILVLYRTMQLRCELPPTSRRRVLILLAVVGGGLSTFRPIFLPLVAVALLFAELTDVWQARISRTAFVREIGLIAVVGLLTLAPWSIALFRAAGSPFWPLLRGNANPHVNFTDAHLPAWTLIEFVVGIFIEWRVLIPLSAGLFLIGRPRWDAVAIFLAAIVGTTLTILSFTILDDDNLVRYTMPMLLAAAIACLLATACAPQSSKTRAVGRAIMVCFSLGLLVRVFYSHRIRSGYTDSWGGALAADEVASPPSLYSEIQSRVPAGSTILTLTDFPILFDYRRNPIYSLDYAGWASPPPGLPLGRGVDAWIRYLRSQSIDYVICQQFNEGAFQGLASQRYYNWQLALPLSFDGLVLVNQRLAPTIIQTMGELTALKRERHPIFERDGLWLISIPGSGAAK